jgi:hypothetical protein
MLIVFVPCIVNGTVKICKCCSNVRIVHSVHCKRYCKVLWKWNRNLPSGYHALNPNHKAVYTTALARCFYSHTGIIMEENITIYLCVALDACIKETGTGQDSYDHVSECFQHPVRIRAALQNPARMGRLLAGHTTAIPPHHRVLFRLLVPPASILCTKSMGTWIVPAGHAHLPVRWVPRLNFDQYVSDKRVERHQVQRAVISKFNWHCMFYCLQGVRAIQGVQARGIQKYMLIL